MLALGDGALSHERGTPVGSGLLGVGVSGVMVQGSGFRVQGSGFRVQGSGVAQGRGGTWRTVRSAQPMDTVLAAIPPTWSWVWDFGLWVWDMWFGVRGLGFGVQGFGFRVSG